MPTLTNILMCRVATATPILRYAEVYCLHAEAKNRTGQIDQTVYDAINQVRHRAGMPNGPGEIQQPEFFCTYAP